MGFKSVPKSGGGGGKFEYRCVDLSLIEFSKGALYDGRLGLSRG